MYATASPARELPPGARARGFGTAMVMGVLLGMLTAEGLLYRQVASHSRLVLVEPWDEGDEIVAVVVTAPPTSAARPAASGTAQTGRASAAMGTLMASATAP